MKFNKNALQKYNLVKLNSFVKILGIEWKIFAQMDKQTT